MLQETLIAETESPPLEDQRIKLMLLKILLENSKLLSIKARTYIHTSKTPSYISVDRFSVVTCLV